MRPGWHAVHSQERVGYTRAQLCFASEKQFQNPFCSEFILRAYRGFRFFRGLPVGQTPPPGRTQITDAGLAHLETLEHLDEIYVDDTQVTDDGIVRLKTTLPSLAVFR
jgi:hypothetical protein